MKKASMKDVAEAAGVSVMTVSYALRYHPRISKETAERVRAVASAMGYAPHPLVSALISEIRSRREMKAPPTIAYISLYANRDAWWTNYSVQRPYYEGARARCEELGFGFELVEPAISGLTGKRLSNILRYRKVCGLICAPVPTPDKVLDIEWEHFPAVAFGHSMPNPPIHRITLNHFQSAHLCLKSLFNLGYERIGIAVNAKMSQRIGGMFLAGVDAFNREVPARRRVSVFMDTLETRNMPTIKAWIKKHRPDVLLDSTPLAYAGLLEEAGFRIPQDIGYATMSWNDHIGHFSGLNQNSFQAGIAAVDVLVQQIYGNRRGIPEFQTFTLINGSWVDGATAPPVGEIGGEMRFCD